MSSGLYILWQDWGALVMFSWDLVLWCFFFRQHARHRKLDAGSCVPLRVVFVCLNVCFHAIQDLWFPFPGNLSMSLCDYGISWNFYVLHEVHLHDVSIVQCLRPSFFSWFLNACRELYNLQFKPLHHLRLGELVIARCLGKSCVCKCFLWLGRTNRSNLWECFKHLKKCGSPCCF